MTIKQLIVGTLLGACAFSSMLHRLPKTPGPLALKPVARHAVKSASRVTHRPLRKHIVEARLSLNKVFD
jgi:hypothetical protein